MIIIKSMDEINVMRKVNAIVAEVLLRLKEMVAPGITTEDLDRLAKELIESKGAIPTFKGYMGYPKHLCTSINDEIVHGIPSSERVLSEGDIIGIDCGATFGGYVGDSAITCPVGKISPEATKLLAITEEALYKGIAKATPEGRLYDISAAVQEHAESHGYSIVRDFVGHGIGRQMHEDPQVPNYGKAGTGIKLRPGLVLALEPMVNMGGPEVRILDDGWTAVTADGHLSAHFEHSVVITEKGPEILSRI